MSIEFDNGWPLIVKDIVKMMTGLDLLKSTIIREADELPTQSFIPDAGFFKEDELNEWKTKFNLKQNSYILHTFRCFMGAENRIEDMKHLEEI